VSFDDWMLALHVLSAFAVVAGIILFWVLIVVVRRTDAPEGTLRLGPLTRVADGAVGVGLGGTIILGIWLAFSIGGYDIWDGWIIAAIVLWAITTALGRAPAPRTCRASRRRRSFRRRGRPGRMPSFLPSTGQPTGLSCSP